MTVQAQFNYFDPIEDVVDHRRALGHKDLWYNEMQLGQGNVYLRHVLLPDGSQVATCRIATRNSSEDKPKSAVQNITNDVFNGRSHHDG